MATEITEALDLFCRPLVHLDGVSLADLFDKGEASTYALRESVVLPSEFSDPKRARFMNLLVLKYARQVAPFVTVSCGDVIEIDVELFESSLAPSVCENTKRALINARHLWSSLSGPQGRQILLAWILSTKKYAQFDSSSLVQLVMKDVISVGLSAKDSAMPC